MSLRSKRKANYIGYWRVNKPDGGSGVWHLQQVHTESTNSEWIDQKLYYNSCDSMSGWSNSGVYSTNGNFYVGGYEAPHPRHENLPAKESVRCRCEVEYQVL